MGFVTYDRELAAIRSQLISKTVRVPCMLASLPPAVFLCKQNYDVRNNLVRSQARFRADVEESSPTPKTVLMRNSKYELLRAEQQCRREADGAVKQSHREAPNWCPTLCLGPRRSQ